MSLGDCLHVSLFAVAICQSMCVCICVCAMCMCVRVKHGHSRWVSLGVSGAVPVLAPFYVSVPLKREGGERERDKESKQKDPDLKFSPLPLSWAKATVLQPQAYTTEDT